MPTRSTTGTLPPPARARKSHRLRLTPPPPPRTYGRRCAPHRCHSPSRSPTTALARRRAVGGRGRSRGRPARPAHHARPTRPVRPDRPDRPVCHARHARKQRRLGGGPAGSRRQQCAGRLATQALRLARRWPLQGSQERADEAAGATCPRVVVACAEGANARADGHVC